jgi:hypothetical protein
MITPRAVRVYARANRVPWLVAWYRLRALRRADNEKEAPGSAGRLSRGD